MGTSPIIPREDEHQPAPPPGFVLNLGTHDTPAPPPGFVLNTETPPEAKEPVSTMGFLKNVAASTYRLGKGVVEAIASPVQTAKGLARLAEPLEPGAALPIPGGRALERKIVTGQALSPESIQAWAALTEEMKNRYGGIDQALATAYDDPAGFAADASILFSGGAGATRGLAKIPALSKAGRFAPVGRALERTGQIAGTAAEVVDPLRTTARVAGAVTERVTRPLRGNLINNILGKTTGRGGETFKIAREIDPKSPSFDAFKKAMTGGITESELLENFRSALQEVKNIRGEQYRARLSKISKNIKSLDVSSIRFELQRQLKNYNIKRAPDGGWDFTRSTIHNAADQTKVRAVIDDIYNWGIKKGDRTPMGLDTLKRRLGDFYSESGQSRSLVRAVHNSVRRKLKQSVPGYAEMTGEYAAASELVESVERGLSLGGQQAQTALTKLHGALKENNAMRKVLVESLEQYVGDPTLKAQLAGYSLKSYTPYGIVGSMSAGTIIGMVVGGAISPEALIALATHSPRVMGEMIVAMSAMADAVRVAAKTARPVIRGATTPGMYRSLQAIREIQARQEAGENENE